MNALFPFWSQKLSKRSKQDLARGCRLAAESLETRAVFSATALTPDLNAASDTGSSATDNRTSDTTPTFTIQAAGATAVKLFRVAGKQVTEIGTASPASGSAWTATLSPLVPGKYSIAARAFTDGVAGKLSKPLAIEIGTAAPSTPTIGLDGKSDSGFKGDRITNLPSPVLAGRGQPGTVVLLTSPSVAGGTEQRIAVNGKGGWSFRAPALADGQHTFTVKSQNVFGLQGGAASLTITIDTVRPIATSMQYLGDDINEIEVVFSRPVLGVDAGDFRLTAQSYGLANVPLNDPRIRNAVGGIVVRPVPESGGTRYRLAMVRPEIMGGVFEVRLIASKSGIVDASSGNLLLLDRSVSATF